MTLALKNLYQSMLFFLVPFYYKTATFDDPNRFFVYVLGLLADALDRRRRVRPVPDALEGPRLRRLLLHPVRLPEPRPPRPAARHPHPAHPAGRRGDRRRRVLHDARPARNLLRPAYVLA
jgi:hypothetical protein